MEKDVTKKRFGTFAVINPYEDEKCLLPIYYLTEDEVKQCSKNTSNVIILLIIFFNIVLFFFSQKNRNYFVLLGVQVLLLLIIPSIIRTINLRQWRVYSKYRRLILSSDVSNFQIINNYIRNLDLNPSYIIYFIFFVYLYLLMPSIKDKIFAKIKTITE